MRKYLTDDMCDGDRISSSLLWTVVRLIKTLKILSYTGCLAQAKGIGSKPQGYVDADYGALCLATFSRLLRTLFERWSRRAFCGLDVWLIPDTESRQIELQNPLGILLLNTMPFCIPFSERMRTLDRWLAQEK